MTGSPLYCRIRAFDGALVEYEETGDDHHFVGRFRDAGSGKPLMEKQDIEAQLAS